nr:serine acetyltransferase [uncultured Macellibacteroides sp.]
MKDIIIYGAGGFGKEIACLLRHINEAKPTWNLIGYLDDNQACWGQQVSHFGTCLGGIDFLNNYPSEIAVILGMGSSNAVRAVREKITNPHVSFPNIIHPTFRINDPETFKIGEGNIIQSLCIVTCDVTMGNFNVLNGAITLGHDVVIGDYNTIMPGVRISGETKVGEHNFFGVGSIVLQQLKIGNRVRLSAGSVLMTKPKDGMLYMGNPAKKTEL